MHPFRILQFISEISCGIAPSVGPGASSPDEDKRLMFMDTAVYNCDPGSFTHTPETGFVNNLILTCLADKSLDKHVQTPVSCRGTYPIYYQLLQSVKYDN